MFDPTGTDNILGFPASDDFQLTGDLTDAFQGVDIGGLIPGPRPTEPECQIRDGLSEICDENSPFRTHSGYCNNLKNPNMGKSLATFARLMPSVYENGVSKPRLTGTSGLPLPSARLISTMIHADISNLHGRYSLMLMQFAQFLDHDLTFTPVHRGFFASIPDCRSCDSSHTVHPECMPIQIPRGDPYYPQVNQTTGQRVCIAFMRSLPGQQQLGEFCFNQLVFYLFLLGPREQINQNSAFLDAAHVYGEHECQGKDLRSGFGGRLNVTRHPVRGKDLLPLSPSHPECKAPSGYCFIAGIFKIIHGFSQENASKMRLVKNLGSEICRTQTTQLFRQSASVGFFYGLLKFQPVSTGIGFPYFLKINRRLHLRVRRSAP